MRYPGIETMIFCAGIAQLILAMSSLAIPHLLGWRQEIAKLRPLTGQVFWTYAGYIWATNVWIGVTSMTMPASLVSRSTLSVTVTCFFALYWGTRLFIEIFWFDRSELRKQQRLRVAEVSLTSLFLALTAIYCWAALVNLGGFGVEHI